MESVFIAARAGVDENAAAPSATVVGPNSASLRVIVMDTSLSCEAFREAWRGGEEMSRGAVAAAIGMAANGEQAKLVRAMDAELRILPR
jgi:hypothetical protein